MLCPITRQGKVYPFEVAVPQNEKVTGFVLADQVKSMSWHERKSEIACLAPDGLLADAKAKISALLAIA